MKTRGEIWAEFATVVIECGYWDADAISKSADEMMAEYDKRFDADGNARQDEGA